MPLCVCVGMGCMGSLVEKGFVYTYAKSCVLQHLCAKECICVSVLSAELPDGCYLSESAGQGGWRGTLIV